MKNVSSTLLFIIIFFWLSTGCKQVDKLTQFNIDYVESFTLPSTLGLNLPFNLKTPSIKTNSEEFFEVNDTRKNLIEINIGTENLDEVLVAWNHDIEVNAEFFVDAKILGI